MARSLVRVLRGRGAVVTAEHGTVGMYTNHGCRCSDCTAAVMEGARRRQQRPCERCGEPCWSGTKGKQYRSGLCRQCSYLARRTAVHGTESRYRAGCRCSSCREASSAARRHRRSVAGVRS